MKRVRDTANRLRPRTQGLKCPEWSAAIAQELLDSAEPVGDTLQATRDGVGFVAQRTRTRNGERVLARLPRGLGQDESGAEAQMARAWPGNTQRLADLAHPASTARRIRGTARWARIATSPLSEIGPASAFSFGWLRNKWARLRPNAVSIPGVNGAFGLPM